MTDVDVATLLANYQPSERAKDIVARAQIVLLVGITGAGKNTLKRELLKDNKFYDYISHTTRPPRSNHGAMEQDGIDYFFIDTAEAIQMLRAGEFIEAKKVHANIYGTAIEGLAPSVKSNTVAVNDVDVQGVEEYKTISPKVNAVFILPPSLDVWNNRRLARHDGVFDPSDNAVRLKSAKMELEVALNKGYFDFVINDDIASAARQVRQIVTGDKNKADSKAAESLARSFAEAL